jgi:hypothetical protein
MTLVFLVLASVQCVTSQCFDWLAEGVVWDKAPFYPFLLSLTRECLKLLQDDLYSHVVSSIIQIESHSRGKGKKGGIFHPFPALVVMCSASVHKRVTNLEL